MGNLRKVLMLVMILIIGSSYTYAWFGWDDLIALGAGCIFGGVTSAVSNSCYPYSPKYSDKNLCEMCGVGAFNICTEYKCRAIGSNCRLQINNGVRFCTSSVASDAPKIIKFGYGEIDKNKVLEAKAGSDSWILGILDRSKAYFIIFNTDKPATCSRASNPSRLDENNGDELKLTNGLIHADGTIFHALSDSDFNQMYQQCPDGGSGFCRDYVQCSVDDVGGRKLKSTIYTILYKLKDTPDTFAPQIRKHSPDNGAMLALNSLVIDFNIGVVDPAGIVDCRYSNQLKNYNDMTEKLDCVSARFENDEVIADEADLEQNFVQQCSKQIPLDLSLDTYDVYVSCKDELGNFHNPAQKFSYRKGKILSMEIKVDDSVYSGAVLELEGRRHSLIASTKGGDNDKSICKYSYSFNDAPFTNMTTFEDTSKITNPITAANAVIQKIHTLILDNLLINSGDYKFKINCYDPIGNDLNSDVMLRARIVGSSGVGTATTLSVIDYGPKGNVDKDTTDLFALVGGGKQGVGRGAECKFTTDFEKAFSASESGIINKLENSLDYSGIVSHGNGAASRYTYTLSSLENGKKYTYYFICKETAIGGITGYKTIEFTTKFSSAQPGSNVTQPGPVDTVPPSGQCEIIETKWADPDGKRSISKIKQNELVVLSVKGRNCADGSKVAFSIYEDDAGPELGAPISSLEGTFGDGEAVAQWNAEWEDDISGNPEYYFKALIEGNLKKSSSLLEVEKIQCIATASCIISYTQCQGKYNQDCNCEDIPNDSCPTVQPPQIISTLPKLIIRSISVENSNTLTPTLTLETTGGSRVEKDGKASCIYGNNVDEVKDDRGNSFSNVQLFLDYTKHSVILSGLKDGDKITYFIKCTDEGNSNIFDIKQKEVSIKVAAVDSNLPKLTISNFKVLNTDTRNPIFSLDTTDGVGSGRATCKYNDKLNVVQSNQGNLMIKSMHISSVNHGALLSDSNEGNYNYFVRCIDDKNDKIYSDAEISFIVKFREEPPVVCPTVYNPVCGNNNVTYGNSCLAGIAGITIVNTGACSTSTPPSLPSSLRVVSKGPNGIQADTRVNLTISLKDGPDDFGVGTCYYTDTFSRELEREFNPNSYDGIFETTKEISGKITQYIKELDGLSIGDHIYYINCKDSQNKFIGLQEVKFNIQIPSSQQISVVRKSPEGIYGGKNVLLEIETNGGLDNGASVNCKYQGILGWGDMNKQQITGGRYLHSATVQNVPNGDYIITIDCRDRANQLASTTLNINVQEDKIAPDIIQIISRGNSKFIRINEVASCESSVDGNQWNAVSKDSETGRKHLIAVSGGYYFRCKDLWNNQMPTVKINP